MQGVRQSYNQPIQNQHSYGNYPNNQNMGNYERNSNIMENSTNGGMGGGGFGIGGQGMTASGRSPSRVLDRDHITMLGMPNQNHGVQRNPLTMNDQQGMNREGLGSYNNEMYRSNQM